MRSLAKKCRRYNTWKCVMLKCGHSLIKMTLNNISFCFSLFLSLFLTHTLLMHILLKIAQKSFRTICGFKWKNLPIFFFFSLLGQIQWNAFFRVWYEITEMGGMIIDKSWKTDISMWTNFVDSRHYFFYFLFFVCIAELLFFHNSFSIEKQQKINIHEFTYAIAPASIKIYS